MTAFGSPQRSVAQDVARLEEKGVFLSLQQGELRYRSPKNALTSADKDALRARREELIGYLAAKSAAKELMALKGTDGPIAPSVAQEMWWRFAGGAHEGSPIALNIPMIGKFVGTDVASVCGAIHDVVARHDTLRTSFSSEGEALRIRLNPAEAFAIVSENLVPCDGELPDAAAQRMAKDFCSQLVPIEGGWLTRAKIIQMPADGLMVAISASHMIADGASRNIIFKEIQNILDGKSGAAGSPAPSICYNAYSLEERDHLASANGDCLIEYWRQWYSRQKYMLTPEGGVPMVWGGGVRVFHNFSLPGQVLEQVRHLASAQKTSPFLVYLTIYSLALVRWSNTVGFAVRSLADKRTTPSLSDTVGLLFCADAIDVEIEPDDSFMEALLKMRASYASALSLRIPSLHYWAPHCVRPGIEARDFPNRIPAAINYFPMGTEREWLAMPTPADELTWPPAVSRPPSQFWSRRMAPIFLHMMDQGSEAHASLHFYEDIVHPLEQSDFIKCFFFAFREALDLDSACSSRGASNGDAVATLNASGVSVA